MLHPIDRAADVVGSQTALADALGVSKGAVSQWKEGGRRIPAEHCPLIEEMTKGAVRCEDMRPDIRWDVLRGKRGRGAAKSVQQPAPSPAGATHA